MLWCPIDTKGTAEDCSAGIGTALTNSQTVDGAISVLSDAEIAARDLRGQNLSGVDLSGRDLAGVNFSGVDLSGAVLSRANLAGCEFRGSTLVGTNFVGAKLQGADFTESDATRAIFGEAELSEAVFFFTNLNGATLSGANANGSDFRVAQMDGARLLNTELTNCDFSKANLARADMTGSMVCNATFREANLTEATLRGLRGYDKADWVNASIYGIEFSGAYLVRRSIMDQNYLHEFRSSDRIHEILYQVWRVTSDCGRSFVRWGFLTAIVAVVFGIMFAQVDIAYGDRQTILSPLYFSVVTLTTLGFGDVLPRSLAAQILVMIEVVVGYVMLGGVLSIFATRMGRRAD